MALDADSIRFLVYAKKVGVDFNSTAMIGRQAVLARPWMVPTLLAPAGINLRKSAVRTLCDEAGGYAEPLLRLLGARTVESFDYSKYEGATHAHDFNAPIPARFHGKYNVVIDGGSLEHIFNFPTAIRNCMEMLTAGGHFVGIMPCNNQPGHGFYQFSPELLWRVFSAENGFEVLKLVLREVRQRAPWFNVVDPAMMKRRVTFVNTQPVLMLVLARKVRQVEVFSAVPQQSDYAVTWQTSSALSLDHQRWSRKRHIVDSLPYGVVEAIWRLQQMFRRRGSRLDAHNFQVFDPEGSDP